MRTTIDVAGRVVIPKRIRDDLGLDAGRDLEINVVDGKVEIEPVPVEMRLEKHGKGLVARPAKPLPMLTTAEVRATLERTRR
jgi:AbrB family looped-hinge helix DNA binding protein